MRKILALIIASTFLTATPVIPTPAEAGGLFETLFPRAAKRRKERRQRKRVRRQRKNDLLFQRSRKRVRKQQKRAKKVLQNKRRAVAVKPTKIKGPSFKVYYPRAIKPVRLARLAKAFSAHEQKLLAADALRKTNPESDLETGAVDVKPKLISEKTVIDETRENGLAPVRLSAGGQLLKSIPLKSSPSLGKAMVTFYKASPEFIWLNEQGQPNNKATAVLSVLADAASYGLADEDYAMPLLSVGDDATESDILRAAMQFEFSTTTAVLRYMADARNGRVDPNRISGYHDFSGLGSNYGKLLTALADNEDPAEQMLSAHPKDKAFDVLKNELAVLREKAVGFDSVVIKRRTFIKPGQTHDQLENIVESIRRKASSELLNKHFDVFSVDHSEGVYSPDVVEMVRDFQRSVKLKPDGIIGKNSISRMGGADPKVQLDKVIYAMERLRWHPDRLGNSYVFINQPQYRATYIKNGKPTLSMRTVVGKPSNQTYFFHDKIEYVEYNPYWGIPRSILVNEMLPKLRRNSNYLDRLGYEITNMRGRKISSSSVDWYGVGQNFPYNVRQPPGRKNALGELKIMFPNKHSIYMHDTPAKSLFKRSRRAFSHGCVRLAEPRKMAAAVLGTKISSIQNKLAGGENKQQRLKQKIPVYVAYFTAWPNSKGKVNYYGDMYGRDKALQRAMVSEKKARAKARGA
ncbi:MAG: L,D-transpeptidase family protein [Rhizobiaceae bacterium]